MQKVYWCPGLLRDIHSFGYILQSVCARVLLVVDMTVYVKNTLALVYILLAVCNSE
ncbi:hypothetical protein Pyn_23500 [Prunus yedoensis var. nudiflora]|uniref:Uncharacterized protein n=1 Tax=Prunus yedoensis var. nudiflora TaxID=2094558 RepID=A0A315AVX7_PRUYE|nr:hypothetical protein Pyn_23500 [Prunus yedoensis var. nudiflora]